MKHVPLLLLLAFTFSLCNLSSKLKKGDSNDSNEGGGAVAEHAVPTGAQLAALSGGAEIKWDQQGMSWTVPPKWTQTTNESKQLVWRSPGGSDAASLIVNISPMDEKFPTDVSINAFYDGAKTRAKNGEVDEVKWLAIDGLKGVEFREANPEKPDGFRRLQWMAYRKFNGQVQLVNVMLATDGKDFQRHQDAMYGILYSTKLVH
jgi:hypothetical protein